MDTQQHITVLLHEAVDALITDNDGIYLDGTFGRGGHSRAILARLSASGRLIAMDKDPAAAAHAREATAADDRLEFIPGSFATLGQCVQERNLNGQLSGILLDLGVSSPQLDEAERGFSFSNDGPLDMRMDPSRHPSAAEWIASAEEADIARVLREYGDERYARRIARAIVGARQEMPITRTQELAKIVAEAHPAWEPHRHPATRAFLAIRLYINRELEELTEALAQGLEALQPGGRMVVISFHSLEDRIVKRFMRRQAQGEQLPRGLPITDDMVKRTMKVLGKAVRPSAEEVQHNVRARSAIMRVAEKLP